MKNEKMLTAMKNRSSRRTYLTTAIDGKSVKKIQEWIDEVNLDYALNFELLLDGKHLFSSMKHSYGMFKDANSIIICKGLKSDIHLKEKVGYYGEELILKATDLGLGTCWVGGTFDKASVSCNENEELVAVITIGNVPEVATAKEKFIHGMITRKKVDYKAIFTGNISPELEQAMEYVLLAPSTLNKRKPHFTFIQGKLTISVADDYYFDLVDLGIFKLHYEIATGKAFPLGNNVQLEA